MRISDWSSDVCSSDLEICGRCGKAPISGERADLGYLDFDDLLHRRSLSRKLRSSQPDRPTQETEQRQNDDGQPPRSEEHTSELQSLMRISYAVFCLTKKQLLPNQLTFWYCKLIMILTILTKNIITSCSVT